jgi:hypothetical protein
MTPAIHFDFGIIALSIKIIVTDCGSVGKRLADCAGLEQNLVRRQLRMITSTEVWGCNGARPKKGIANSRSYAYSQHQL